MEEVFNYADVAAFVKVSQNSLYLVLMIPFYLRTAFELYLSCKRLEKFLVSDELDKSWIEKSDKDIGVEY